MYVFALDGRSELAAPLEPSLHRYLAAANGLHADEALVLPIDSRMSSRILTRSGR